MIKGERFPALQYRDFRFFILGQLISLSGTWMQSVAQGWLVYSLTKSPFYLGVVAAAGSLPILLFSLLGGIVADRFMKRNLLLVTQALSIIPALLLGILTDLHLITVWQVALLAMLLGMVNAFDIPTRQAFFIEIVGREHLLNAVALHSATFHSARIIGPVIAGMIIAYMSLPACFYLNAASFLAIIFALSKMKAKGVTKTGSEGLLRDLTEGIKFIKSKPEIYRIILLIAVFSLIGLPFISLLPVFVVEVLSAGPEGFGFLLGATGAGSLSGALMLAFRRGVKEEHKFLALTGISFPLSLFVFSLSRTFPLSMVALFFAGWGIVSFLATSNSLIQLSSPDRLRGRVMSVYTLVFLGFTPLGNSLIGIVADAIGTINAVAISAIICTIASIIFLMVHIRKTS